MVIPSQMSNYEYARQQTIILFGIDRRKLISKHNLLGFASHRSSSASLLKDLGTHVYNYNFCSQEHVSWWPDFAIGYAAWALVVAGTCWAVTMSPNLDRPTASAAVRFCTILTSLATPLPLGVW